MSFRKVTIAALFGVGVLAISALMPFVHAADVDSPLNRAAILQEEAYRKQVDQLVQAFGHNTESTADIFMVGTDLKQPVISGVKFWQWVDSPAGGVYRVSTPDGTNYTIPPSQIAFVRVNKKK